MTKIRVINQFASGKDTYPAGTIVDASKNDPAEVKRLVDNNLVELFTKVRVEKTRDGTNYLPIGKSGTYPKGTIVDVSENDPEELQYLICEELVKVVADA